MAQTYYHVTEQRIVPVLLKFGILLDCATNARRVWVCSGYKLGWAYKHLAEVHGWRVSEMGHVQVNLPSTYLQQLVRFRNGVYYLKIDIPPEFLRPEKDKHGSICTASGIRRGGRTPGIKMPRMQTETPRRRCRHCL